MNRFQMAVICPVCSNAILASVVLDETVRPGVVVLDCFQMELFHCEECGTKVYTGDVECMYEYEESAYED